VYRKIALPGITKQPMVAQIIYNKKIYYFYNPISIVGPRMDGAKLRNFAGSSFTKMMQLLAAPALRRWLLILLLNFLI
jgi:hypothetical protein